jgi:hypothetical protein
VSSSKCVTIMALNPNQLQVTTNITKANAILERVHKFVNDMLRFFDSENNHENLEESKNKKIIHLITSFNQLYGYHAIRRTYPTTLQATPCPLVFGRDMIHNIAFRAIWDQIQKRKRGIINKINQKEIRVKFLTNIRLETKCY